MPLDLQINQNYISLIYHVVGRRRQPNLAVFCENDELRCIGIREQVIIGQNHPNERDHATNLLADLIKRVLEENQTFQNIPAQDWMRNQFGVGQGDFQNNYQWYTYNGESPIGNWVSAWILDAQRRIQH